MILGYNNLKWVLVFFTVQRVIGVNSLRQYGQWPDTDESTSIKNFDRSLEKIRYNTVQVDDLNHFVIVQDDRDDETKKEELRRLKPILKKLKRALVKRVIPTGYKSPIVEYDKKYNTFYKPIVKFHRIKATTNSDGEDSNKNWNNFKTRSEQSDEILLQPFKQRVPRRYERNEIAIQENIMADILYLLRTIISKSSKRKPMNYEKLLVSFDEPLVRTLLRNKTENPADITNTGPKPKTYPFYHLWNKWTYQNTILHDECPQNQIKKDHVCVAIKY